MAPYEQRVHVLSSEDQNLTRKQLRFSLEVEVGNAVYNGRQFDRPLDNPLVRQNVLDFVDPKDRTMFAQCVATTYLNDTYPGAEIKQIVVEDSSVRFKSATDYCLSLTASATLEERTKKAA